MMAEDVQGGDDDEIFVFMGGDQRVPDGVRRARIHKSVKIVRANAFKLRRNLISVEFHDGVEIIEEQVFMNCRSLRSIKLLGVKIIKKAAFFGCGLTDVDFGNKLETLERSAFNNTALKKISMPSVRTVGKWAFANCSELSDVKCGEALRTLVEAFDNCPKLKRISLPLKGNMIEDGAFYRCPMLTTIHLVGGTHQTVASLHMESWRIEMNYKINRINQTLPTNEYGKTAAIQQWMRSTFRQLEHYKTEHHKVLKEATTLLELALWKANLVDNGGGGLANEGVRITRGRKRARAESCVTSGADVVIKNVLPFLKLE